MKPNFLIKRFATIKIEQENILAYCREGSIFRGYLQER